MHGDEINQAESRNIYGYNTKLIHKYFLHSGSLISTYGGGFRYDATDSTLLSHVEKRNSLEYLNLGRIKELNSFGFIDQQLNIQYTVNSRIQLYAKTGKGFHSNDTRVVIGNMGYQILPAAYGSDLGVILKPNDRLLLNIAAWYLYLDQEFVYNGDDANLSPSGATVRQGIDIIARYQFAKNLFANANINFTKPKALNVAKGHDFIGLAPTTTSTGGLFYKRNYGINGGLSYKYIADRSANEDNSIVAKGYFIWDGSVNYTGPKYEIGLAFENIFNSKWNEAQFATESRLRNEAASVTELNFTPGIPFFVRA